MAGPPIVSQGHLTTVSCGATSAGSVPVTCEIPQKRRKNKRVFAPITRYRDTTGAGATRLNKKAHIDLPEVPEIARVSYQCLRRECGSARIVASACVVV